MKKLFVRLHESGKREEIFPQEKNDSNIALVPASYWRGQFTFVKDETLLKNLSYQLQYLQFLVELYNFYDITLSIKSHLFKSIILSINSVAEASLHYAINTIRENNSCTDKWNDKYIALIKQASENYNLISKDLENDLHELRKVRNYLHIQSNQETELNYYTEDEINNAFVTLEDLQTALSSNIF